MIRLVFRGSSVVRWDVLSNLIMNWWNFHISLLIRYKNTISIEMFTGHRAPLRFTANLLIRFEKLLTVLARASVFKNTVTKCSCLFSDYPVLLCLRCVCTVHNKWWVFGIHEFKSKNGIFVSYFLDI